MKRTLFGIITIIILLGAVPLANMAASTTATLTPANQTIAAGATTTVSFYIQDVQDLYAYQVAFAFNAAVLEVIDADTAKTGIQVALGSFLLPDFVPQNNADNSLGTIVCVVTQIAPHTGVNGSGTLLTITFRGKAAGTSTISFTDLKLARADSTQISVSEQNAQIVVSGGTVPTATPTATTTGPTATPTATTTGPTATPTATTASPTATPTATTTGPTATPTATTTGPTATPTATPQPTATLAPGQTVVYVVRSGDTLYSIARRFGVDMYVLARLNNIANPSRIYVGQRLTIPRAGEQPIPTPVSSTYIVRPGDTLYSIARRYGTTVEAIATLNHIVNPSRIFAGQRLTIYGSATPAPQPSGRIHIVQAGETVYSIARRYNTTAWAIAVANHLYNPNIIYAGQRLVIP